MITVVPSVKEIHVNVPFSFSCVVSIFVVLHQLVPKHRVGCPLDLEYVLLPEGEGDKEQSRNSAPSLWKVA